MSDVKAATPIPRPSMALVRHLDAQCRALGGHIIAADTRFCTACGLPGEALAEVAPR